MLCKDPEVQKQKLVAYRREWKELHKQEIKEYNQRPEIKQRQRENARRWRNNHLEEARENSRRWRAEHPEQKPRITAESKMRNAEQHHLDKVNVVMHYSNPTGATICNHCGIQDIDTLCIDHIEGGGNKHRTELGITGSRFYHWLIKNDYPEGYQVLCYNCNNTKRII